MEPYVCSPTASNTCKVGDLSGKNGDLVTGRDLGTFNDFTISMMDLYGRAIVVRNAAGEAVSCADVGFVVEQPAVPFDKSAGFGALITVVAVVGAVALLVGIVCLVCWYKRRPKAVHRIVAAKDLENKLFDDDED